MKSEKIKSIAEINNVKELMLICNADLFIWSDYLKKFNHAPLEFNGKARLLLSISELKYMKIRFKEFIISIFIDDNNMETNTQAFFLLSAYNSNIFFSWSERTFFSTPYHSGQISFDSQKFSKASVTANKNKAIVITNSMNDFRKPKSEGYDKWEGRVYLPGNNRTKGKFNKWFYAGIEGDSKKYDYFHNEDSITFKNTESDEIFNCLSDSNISGYEWITRNKAFHTKSGTFSS